MVNDNDVIHDSRRVAYGLVEVKILMMSYDAYYRSRVIKCMRKIKSVTSNR